MSSNYIYIKSQLYKKKLKYFLIWADFNVFVFIAMF